MLSLWEVDARAENVSEELIRAVASRLHDYHHLTPRSRAETLEGLMRRIQRDVDEKIKPLIPYKEPGEPKTAPGGIRKPEQARRDFRRPEPPAQGSRRPPDQQQPRDQAAPYSPRPAQPETPAQPAVQKTAGDPGADTFTPSPAGEPAARPETWPSPKPAEAAPSVPAAVTAPRPAPEGPPAALNAPLTVLQGVGNKHAATLSRLNLHTLGDMLYYFPRRYDDYSKLLPINRLFYGQEVTVIATVQSISTRPARSGKMHITEMIVNDGTGALRVNWFNQSWHARRLHPGLPVVLSGKIDQYLGRLVMNSPEVEQIDVQNLNTNRIVPVYPLTAEITQRWLRKLMFAVIEYWAPRLRDYLPENVRRSAELLPLPQAIHHAHFPNSLDLLKSARQRLAFDEFFLLQLGVLRQKRNWQDRSARKFETPEDWFAAQVERLPFQLTGAQMRSTEEIRADLQSGQPMNRLLQGDVGAGKTVVAALAIAAVTRSGAQATLMAPTSILAEQHYRNMLRLLAGAGTDQASDDLLVPAAIRLLVGSTPETEKDEIRAGLADGSIRLVVGTHALIEDPVVFADLQLAVVDEQHRFGVEQRAALRAKGDNPHLLVMTATPIPRSLALTLYGDLDLSVLDEMPPGRQKVDTFVLFPRERERAYALINAQIAEGHQAFMIYPLVEENENSDAKAAVEEHARLQKEVFPNRRLGLLHGRMKPEEKDAVMSQFRDHQLDILVSTSVVEVGVDVPNATVMLIEGANRFGLAQLHQFRGRVGRGQDKSYCLLIPETPDAVENERLSAMAETNDGFVLAERDLDQRGPGDFLGTRQSGYSDLKMASLSNIALIEKARRFALELFEQDPDLSLPEHSLLAATMHRFWGEPQGDIS